MIQTFHPVLTRYFLSLALVGALVVIPCRVMAQDDPVDEEIAVEQEQSEQAQKIVAFPRDESKEEIEPVAVETRTGDPIIEDMVRRTLIRKLGFRAAQMPSLFFSPREQALIAEVRKGLVARPPTESEVRQAQRAAESGNSPPPPAGPRELALGGIVYTSSADWTIWLNGQKITPDRIPSEVHDIRVHKDYIKLKWYDAYTNQIFPIKLRTHQRFNIDTRIFLPGA